MYDLDEGEKQEDPLLKHPILQEFLDIFPNEILCMPLKHDINFLD